MKKLLIISLCLLSMGCERERNVSKTTSNYTLGGVDLEIVVIDGCQYLTRSGSSSYDMTHKGNCNNPIHKCNVIHDTVYLPAIDNK